MRIKKEIFLQQLTEKARKYVEVRLRTGKICKPPTKKIFPLFPRESLIPIQFRINYFKDLIGGYSKKNDIQILSGEDAYSQMKIELGRCKHTINFEVYIFKLDETGREIFAILLRKIKEGVKIKILLDYYGSQELEESMEMKIFLKLGGEVRFFRRFSLLSLLRFDSSSNKVFNRNHRKIITIDNKIGFIGGMNIGNEYFGIKSAKGTFFKGN
jgi:phosphatidylserine/phosphatidylglycerophosphate/cardiolipin synthase-like enzyme